MERMGEGGMRADGGGRYSDFQLYFIFLRDPNCKVNPRFPQLKLGVGGGGNGRGLMRSASFHRSLPASIGEELSESLLSMTDSKY